MRATTVFGLPTHGTFVHCGSAMLLALRTSMSGDCQGRCADAGHGRIDGSGRPLVP
jgi:hypothetical protein